MEIQHYKQALKKISKAASGKKIISCYDYGSYKNPGLSDIDLFVILKNSYNAELKKFIKEIKKGDNNFFFEYSTIIITNINFFKNIKIFDDLRVNNIFGKKIKLNNFADYRNDLKLLSILEWLPERMIRIKENINNYKYVNVRQHLGLLNSFKYTLNKTLSFLNSKQTSFYIKSIDIIRREKNIKNKKKKVYLLTKKLFKFGEKLIEDFSKIEKLNKNNLSIKGEFSMIFPNKSKLIFTNKKLLQKKNSMIIPLIYSLPFSYHLRYKNSLYKIIKNYLRVSKNYSVTCKNKKILKILKKRNKLLSENVELLKKNNINKGIYKFGWYLNNEKKF